MLISDFVSESESRWISLMVRAEGAQGEVIPINGPVRTVFSDLSGAPRSIKESLFKTILLDAEEAFQSMGWGQGYSNRFTSEGLRITYSVAKTRPGCRTCDSALPVQDTIFDGDLRCSHCGASNDVHPAPYWLTALVPSACQVIGAVREGQRDGLLVDRMVALRCHACRESIEARPETPRLSECPNCAGQVWLPDQVWGRLHPEPEVHRWYVRMVGELPGLLQDLETDTAPRGFEIRDAKDPKEVLAVLQFVQDPTERARLEQQLEDLKALEALWEEDAARSARPLLAVSWFCALMFMPLSIWVAWLAWVPADPSPVLELAGLGCVLFFSPALLVAQRAVQVRAGIPLGEAASAVGFHGITAAIPVFGAFAAISAAWTLIGGVLVTASILNADGKPLRPYPAGAGVSFGSYGWPAAVLLLFFGLVIQAMWARALVPYLAG